MSSLSIISPAYAQQADGVGSILGSFLPLIIIFAIFYFLLIRPQQKKQKAHREKVSAVKKGDGVLLGGGFYGLVTNVINEHDAEVEISPGVRIVANKQAMIDVFTEGLMKDQKPTPVKAVASRGRGKTAKPAQTSRAKKKEIADDSTASADSSE